jgi:hypothetical protein
MALPCRNSYNSPELEGPYLMEDYFKKISNILRRTSLTERERIDMRLNLTAFIDEHPATAPFSIRVRSRISNIFLSNQVHFGSRAALAALSLVLMAGVSTSYAAQTALPGNPLYTVKIAINEPVERATVASSQSETEWDLTLANRRLQEAEKLAASGSLNPKNAAIVETQLNTDTQNFDQSVTASATSSADAAQVADAQSDLEAALSAHSEVLAALASSTPTSQDQVAPILASIRTRIAKARGARIAALATFDADATSSSLRIAASSEMQAAVSQLGSVRALARSMIKSASSTAQLADDASTTEVSIAVGNSSLAHGHFKEALAAFQAATRAATETQVGLEAQVNLGASVTLPIVSSDASSSNMAATPTAETSTSTTPDQDAATTTIHDDLNL